MKHHLNFISTQVISVIKNQTKPTKQHEVVLARKQVNISLMSSKTKQMQRDEKCVCEWCGSLQ